MHSTVRITYDCECGLRQKWLRVASLPLLRLAKAAVQGEESKDTGASDHPALDLAAALSDIAALLVKAILQEVAVDPKRRLSACRLAHIAPAGHIHA